MSTTPDSPIANDRRAHMFPKPSDAPIARGSGYATLIGSRHSAGTLRLQEFFTRNGHPYAYIDVETDAEVQGLLDRFRVGVADVPVVICRGEVVLKNPTNEEIADCF